MADIVQGTPEWHAARLGKVTASRVADVIARTKSGYATSRKNYMTELVLERLTGTVADTYTSSAMQWGIDHEADARVAYQFELNTRVATVGFVDHPTIEHSGASPDGLVGETGLVEIKCPNSATHLDTIKSGEIPSRYVTQMLWQMACTGRAWCDFVSYDPRFPDEMQIFIKRLDRDDKAISALEAEVIAFLQEVDEAVDALRQKFISDIQEAA